MIGALIAGRTFVKNFPGPIALVAALCLVVGGALSWGVTRAWHKGEVAQAQAQTVEARAALASYRADVARAAADATNEARTLEREAYEARIRERDTIVAAINEGFRAAATQEAKTRETIRRELAAPEWACLRDPLPDAVIDRLLEQANGTP